MFVIAQLPPPEEIELQLLLHPNETVLGSLPASYLKTTSNCTGPGTRFPVICARLLHPKPRGSCSCAHGMGVAVQHLYQYLEMRLGSGRNSTHQGPVHAINAGVLGLGLTGREWDGWGGGSDFRIALLKGPRSLVLPVDITLRQIVTEVRVRRSCQSVSRPRPNLLPRKCDCFAGAGTVLERRRRPDPVLRDGRVPRRGPRRHRVRRQPKPVQKRYAVQVMSVTPLGRAVRCMVWVGRIHDVKRAERADQRRILCESRH